MKTISGLLCLMSILLASSAQCQDKKKSESNAKKTVLSSVADVEKENSLALVASEYGFDKRSLDGKTVLVPLTQTEYIDLISNLAGFTSEQKARAIAKIRAGAKTCFLYSRFECRTPDGCGMCTMDNVGTAYFCYCHEMFD